MRKLELSIAAKDAKGTIDIGSKYPTKAYNIIIDGALTATFWVDCNGVKPSAYLNSAGDIIILADESVVLIDDQGVVRKKHDLTFPVFDLHSQGDITIIEHELGAVRIDPETLDPIWSYTNDISDDFVIDWGAGNLMIISGQTLTILGIADGMKIDRYVEGDKSTNGVK